MLAQIVDQHLVQRIIGEFTVVVAPLIPDRASDGITEPRVQHRIKQRGWIVLSIRTAIPLNGRHIRAHRKIGRESKHRIDSALRPNFKGQSGRVEFQLLNIEQPGAVMIVRHHGDAVPASPHTAARNRVFSLGTPVSRSLYPGRTDRLSVEEGRIDIVDDAELQLKLPAGKLRRQLETQAADITTGPEKWVARWTWKISTWRSCLSGTA